MTPEEAHNSLVDAGLTHDEAARTIANLNANLENDHVAAQGQSPAGDLAEHSGIDQSGTPTEAGGGDRVQDGGAEPPAEAAGTAAPADAVRRRTISPELIAKAKEYDRRRGLTDPNEFTITIKDVTPEGYGPVDGPSILTSRAKFTGSFANVASGSQLITSDGHGSFLVTYAPTALPIAWCCRIFRVCRNRRFWFGVRRQSR